MNYYTRKIIQHRDGAWPNYAEGAHPPAPDPGWDGRSTPEGLRDLLIRNATEYSGDLPIHVTENGMANPDTPDMPDTARIEYLERHLDAVREAIAAGAPVAGYYCWSLMDNYEWSLGYEKRFGLVHVDFDSLARDAESVLSGRWRAGGADEEQARPETGGMTKDHGRNRPEPRPPISAARTPAWRWPVARSWSARPSTRYAKCRAWPISVRC